MNLNSQDKKLLFKLVITALIVIVLVFSYFKGMGIYNDWQDKQNEARIEVKKLHQNQVDSLTMQNIILLDSINNITTEIDSLRAIKTIITQEHEEEINIIYDANVTDHAEWLDAIVTKLKDNP